MLEKNERISLCTLNYKIVLQNVEKRLFQGDGE